MFLVALFLFIYAILDDMNGALLIASGLFAIASSINMTHK